MCSKHFFCRVVFERQRNGQIGVSSNVTLEVYIAGKVTLFLTKQCDLFLTYLQFTAESTNSTELGEQCFVASEQQSSQVIKQQERC